MGSKLLTRVWRTVDRARERVESDSAIMSPPECAFKKTEGMGLKADERPPAMQSLFFIKDYKEVYFSHLLQVTACKMSSFHAATYTQNAIQELRPPKITADEYVELVDRIEKLSRAGLREPTGDKIIQLLEKYDVVVPKEILMSLSKDLNQVVTRGGHRLLLNVAPRMTERQRLAAPRAEAPPTWSLSTCKGLHQTAASECRLRYQPSHSYCLSRMHHEDGKRRRAAIGKPESSNFLLSSSSSVFDHLDSHTFLTHLDAEPTEFSRSRSSAVQIPSISDTSARPSNTSKTRRIGSVSPSPARSKFQVEKREKPWSLEKAPEPVHLCIDATKNTYTIAENTPRQTLQTQSQQSMHKERFIFTELGSKVIIA